MRLDQPFPFKAPRETLGALNAESAAQMAEAAGDLTLVIDSKGRIIDAAFAAGDPTGMGPPEWFDRSWIDTVTAESRNKVSEMMAAAASGSEAPRWRQVNHPTANGDVPVRYIAIPTGTRGRIVAIGRDLRSMAAMQQRLIQTQQSLERDYLRLRQAESRYKMLFDLGTEPVLIVDAETRRIKEANPAAAALAGASPAALLNRPLTAFLSVPDQETAIAYLGSAAVADDADPVLVTLADGEARVALSATAFRQDRAAYFLVRLAPAEASIGGATGAAHMLDVIERMPDAFVLTDAATKIVTANAAFLEVSQAVSLVRLKGVPLGDFLGRAGIDIDLIVDQLREHGAVRSVATIVRGRSGAIEQVEVSAVIAPTAQGDMFGFSIRNIARRVSEAPPADRDLPRSVEQLTELVGRMSLKDIVRESTDLIERLCIEAALEYTSDNRASAAEILGVSRQSLYSKLHRHGLGNLVSEED